MTHWPPPRDVGSPSYDRFMERAGPYLQDARNYFSRGVPGLLKGRGVQVPEWMDRTVDFMNNETVNAAIGMAGPLKAERFMWPVRMSYGKTIDMPVSVNPSRSMIQRELAQAPHGDVRALRSPNGDVYMWPANEAMHVDIADTFDLPFKTRQHLQSNSYLFNKGDVEKLGGFSSFDDLVSKLKTAADE